MTSSPTRAEPAERSAAAGHLRNVLGALAVAATDLLTEDAQASGYHPAEHAAIILVGTADGLSQEDLQRRLGLSQPGTTRLVDRLAARGLLTRAPGPDRRTNALRLTTAGAREAEHALAHGADRTNAGHPGPLRPLPLADLPRMRPGRLRRRAMPMPG
jgi:DNA-binding MarR family transcriptional regulator